MVSSRVSSVRRFRVYLLSLVLGLGLLPSSWSQISTTGKITGVVTDRSGADIPNATVKVKSPALMSNRSLLTQGDGGYLFDLLPSGTYEVTITAKGVRELHETGVVITAGFTATVNAERQLGERTQAVFVQGQPVVDLQNVQTSTTFDQTLLQDIPSGRDPWSTVEQVPGATSSTFDVAGNNSYQQSIMQVHGSTPPEQIYSFNGLDLNWPGLNGGEQLLLSHIHSFFQVLGRGLEIAHSLPPMRRFWNKAIRAGS